MKKSIQKLLPVLIAISIFTASCKKEEGSGGTSVITGKVIERQYNVNFTILTEQFYAPDEDVFIVYGDDPVYGDKVSTNYDGTYRFEYLREGDYTIFAYSEDSANYPSTKMIPVIKHVRITKKDQTVRAEDIIILR